MKFLCKMSLTVLALAITQVSFSFDLFRPYQGPGQDIETLVVTANYRHPRILADLIQAESRQPYLLIPARQDVNQEIMYFCPVNNNKPALQVKKADFKRFVQFMNPKQVVILGDTSYVPSEYEKLVDPNIPVIIIRGDDWSRAATSLSTLLNLTNLKKDYATLSSKLDANALYKPERVKNEVLPTVQPPAPQEGFDVTLIEEDPLAPTSGSVDVEESVTELEPAPVKEEKKPEVVKAPVAPTDPATAPAKAPAKAPAPAQQ